MLRLTSFSPENPWDVAEAFCMKYKLPVDNAQAIVQHILKNTPQTGESRDTLSGNKMLDYTYKSGGQGTNPAPEPMFQSKYFPNVRIRLFSF